MQDRSSASVAALCAFLFTVLAGPAAAEPPLPRLRPVSARISSLLTWARSVSPTIAELAHALERSGVIVHIDYTLRARRGVVAETRLIAHAGGQRYLRISIDARLLDHEAVALLGHELQHAREIADARWVVDQATMVRLFDAIGHRVHHEHGRTRVDTAAGPAAARRVTAELRAARHGGADPNRRN